MSIWTMLFGGVALSSAGFAVGAWWAGRVFGRSLLRQSAERSDK